MVRRSLRLPIYIIAGVLIVAFIGRMFIPRHTLPRLWYVIMKHQDIRPYEDRDKEQVKSMFADDWHLLISDYSQEHGYDMDLMLDKKSSDQTLATVGDLTLKSYEKDGKVLGFSAYYKKSKNRGHILFITVDKNARKQGVARKLVSDALRDLFEQGVVKVTLDTREGNHVARKVYEKLGFKLIGKDHGYVHLAFYKGQPLP